MSDTIEVREAREEDVDGIRTVFLATYGNTYPYPNYLDDWWLKRSIFAEDILMLAARDTLDGRVVGTASVVFDAGANSDLLGEFGRLAVHPDARGRGVGAMLMDARVQFCQRRLHVGIVENRTVHDRSQRISERHGFVSVGFLPLKLLFDDRESVSMYVRPFGPALGLRHGHARIVPEVHGLAHLALDRCGLPFDPIVDEVSAPYPHESDFELGALTDRGLTPLLRIERGRVRNREIFGPMRLQYGAFMLMARRANYLVARQPVSGDTRGPIAGAIGFIRDDHERMCKVFELIARTDEVVRFLWERLLAGCEEWGIEYVGTDVSANAPRMQRTLLELGFLPAAYVPAMVFHHVERRDVVRMVRLLVPPEVGELELVPDARVVADLVMKRFERQAVVPQVAAAMHHLHLFCGLNPEQATRLGGLCSLQHIRSGTPLWRQGEPADRIAILIAGRVRIRFDGREIGTVGSHDTLGEVSVLTGNPHSADAIAASDVTAAVLRRDRVLELARQRPDIGVVMYRNLAVSLGRKLQRTDEAIAELS